MVFSSLIFIFIFLPLVLISYYVAPKRLRNTIILLASLIFYAWGEPIYIVLIIISILINYLGALLIRVHINNKEKSKFIFITILLIDISMDFIHPPNCGSGIFKALQISGKANEFVIQSIFIV